MIEYHVENFQLDVSCVQTKAELDKLGADGWQVCAHWPVTFVVENKATTPDQPTVQQKVTGCQVWFMREKPEDEACRCHDAKPSDPAGSAGDVASPFGGPLPRLGGAWNNLGLCRGCAQREGLVPVYRPGKVGILPALR